MRRRESLAKAALSAQRGRRFQSGVIVTGASGGIGRAISLAFAEAGWFIGVHYHRNKQAAEATLQEVCSVGGGGSLHQADIRDAQEVQQMIAAFSRDAPDVSVLVCNAGIADSSLVLQCKEDDWSKIIATNLSGTFHCLKAVGPILLARGGGSVVVIGSHAGLHGSTGQAAYAASKAGLIGLVKTAAQEWGPGNVRVNLLLPGWHKTGLSGDAMPAAEGYRDHALRRPPSISEVARTAMYIAQLQDVSGQITNCDSRNL